MEQLNFIVAFCLTKTLNFMEILTKIGSWATKLTEIGISVISLGVVLEVLFGGVGIPFWNDISVVDNIMGILGNLNAEGLLGLVGAFVLVHILKKK
jgi:hypothetical protein|tara:strand:+ start:258 stop:545 length:288 start_codon:yes stop_codon:yes gene_type:complete